MKRLHLLRPGSYRDSRDRPITLSAQDVADIAATYDPAHHEAPIVVGHPRTDDPAYGWIAGLEAGEDGLHAAPRQVDPQFAELVRAGRFRKISVSLYPPDDPGNPSPGKWHLRHVGFLGAQPPAVKGLAPAQLAASDRAVALEADLADREAWARPWVFGSIARLLRRLRDGLIADRGLAHADHVLPEHEIQTVHDEETRLLDVRSRESEAAERRREAERGRAADFHRALKSQTNPEPALAESGTNSPTDSPTDGDPTMSDPSKQDPPAGGADLAERESALAERERAAAAREADLERRELAATLAEAAEFAERMVREGRVLPRDQGAVAELLTAIPAEAQVTFAEGGAAEAKPAPAGKWLRDFLGRLPVQVDYQERTPPAGGEPGAANFSAPPGRQVGTRHAELHERATQHAREHNVSYEAAIARLTEGGQS